MNSAAELTIRPRRASNASTNQHISPRRAYLATATTTGRVSEHSRYGVRRQSVAATAATALWLKHSPGITGHCSKAIAGSSLCFAPAVHTLARGS